MATKRFKYLRPEDVRALTALEFVPKALADGLLAGRHRSSARGASIEFRDYRQFVPGDDPALIDWRVYARTDRRYLRTYEQETNVECHVFLDSSASMGFGAGVTKLDYASFFCAALAYLVVRGNDRISLQIFDERIRFHAPPGSTRRHLHNLLRALETNAPGGRTRLAEALRRSHPLLKRRGTLVVLSDFLDDPAAIFHALSPYLHRGFRIHLFHVLHPDEIELARRGLLTFRDLETGGRLVAHTEELRAAYAEAMRAHVAGMRRFATRRGIDYAMTSTAAPYLALFDRLT
ncbi:MAG: DUF58 domain-containing protein [Kiritimatiellia bacterium]